MKTWECPIGGIRLELRAEYESPVSRTRELLWACGEWVLVYRPDWAHPYHVCHVSGVAAAAFRYRRLAEMFIEWLHGHVLLGGYDPDAAIAAVRPYLAATRRRRRELDAMEWGWYCGGEGDPWSREWILRWRAGGE